MTEPNATARRNVDEILDDLGELAERQAALESRFCQVMDNLGLMASELKTHVHRTRKRAFIEQAAVRLLPSIYGHMTHNSEYDRINMARSAVERAAALWDQVELYFENQKDETNAS